MSRYVYAFVLILAAALSRMLPHPANMVPVTALALFGGVYLDRKLTFIVPLVAMLVTDWFIGFHSTTLWVYVSFLLIGLIGLWLRNHRGVLPTLGATVTGSVLFYLITNFGVWLSPPYMYEQTLSGLVQCYVAAIPFLRNTLAGDLFYVGALFGLYEMGKRLIPSLREQTA
ncbi:MAG: hypothetical protein H6Q30_1459 [Bacteroidetes bacterium]|jgi:hypothetical protein|nr:hypothetical protein [Bacteroidota bacterium]